VRITPEIIFGPVGGAVADRFGRKRVMIACDATRAILMFALAGIVLVDAPVAVALAIVFVATAVGTPSLPAVGAITPSLVDEDALGPANSLISVVDYTALALGPALGGVLVILGSATSVYAINGATFLLSAALLVRIRERAVAVETATVPLKETVVEGLKALRASPEATTLLALIPPTSFVPGVSFVTFVLVSDRFLDTGPGGATFLFAAVGVGGLVGSGLVARANRSRRPGSIVGVTTVLVGLSFAGLAFVRSAPVAYLLMGVLGAAIILGDVVTTTMLQRLLSEDVLGRIFWIMGTLIYSAILIGSLVAPALVTSFGLGPSLVISGAVSVVMVAAATKRLLAVDRATPGYLDDIASPLSLLHSLPIFHAAPASSLEAMARSSTEERVPKGQIAIREGEPATDFFVVVSGALSVLSSGEKGPAEGRQPTSRRRLLRRDRTPRENPAHRNRASDRGLNRLSDQRRSVP
jgi:MFS family permease